MRRWTLAIVVLIVFGALSLTTFSAWLLYTTDGAVWLLENATTAAGVQVKAGRIEGRLSDELVVEALVFNLPDGQVVIRKVNLDWQPFSALQGNLKINLLEVDQFVFESFSSNGGVTQVEQSGEGGSEAGFSVTDLGILPDWLSVEIAELRINGFLLQGAEGSVRVFDSLSGSFVATQQQLRASVFSFLSSSVDLKGHFDWNLRTPHLEMIADVHLPKELINHQQFEDIDVPVDFPGRLSLDGDWNDFSGLVSFGTETTDRSKFWLAADAKGSWQGIHFNSLKGHYLGGRLDGDLDLWWIDSFHLRGQLLAAGLNPGIFLSDITGLATVDVAGELVVPYDETPIKAHIDGKIIEGQLRDAKISGALALDWQNGGLYEVAADLSSRGTHLFAKGKPDERLAVDVSIEDLSNVYAGMSGQLNGAGWLRWSDGYLTGELSGSGSDVVWQETSLQSFNYQASHLNRQLPIKVLLDGRNLRYEKLQSDSLQAEVTGSLEHHSLLVTVHDPAGQLTARFSGGYLDDIWQGELSALEGGAAALGSWVLEKPSRLVWMNGLFSLDDLVLNGERGGRVSLDVTDLGAAQDSSLALDWQDIQHDWFAYLQPELSLSGNSSGHFLLELSNYQPVSLKARMAGNLHLQDMSIPIDLPSVDLDMLWVDSGLSLDIKADTAAGEHFEVTAASTQPPAWQWPSDQLVFSMKWRDVDLGRFSPFREGLTVQGSSDGRGQFKTLGGVLQHAQAEITADVSMLKDSEPVGFRSLSGKLLWDEKILRSEARIEGVHDGLITVIMTSTAEPVLAWPSSGDVAFLVDDFDLRSVIPFVPIEANLVGAIQGEANGYWREAGEVSFQGRFGVIDDVLSLQLPGGQVGDVINRANLDWQWQGSQLEGQLEVHLASGGDLQGRWKLPLSTSLPVNFSTDGPITANLKGDAQLSEIISTFAPDVFQDVRGRLTSDLSISGTLKSPHFSGTLDLTEAGAYLPITGATIDDLLLHLSLQDDEIHLDQLSLKAGEGTLVGKGQVDFDRWTFDNYRITLKGERLHVYNFPELQVFCSPDLTLDGDLSTTRLRGNLLIPEMDLIDKSTGTQTLPSEDVVVHGENEVDREKLTFDADIQVVIELGDKVRVKTEGLETRLEGGITIARDESRHLAGWGEIRLVDGVYKAYGTNLEIKQGAMHYDNDPLVNPTLRVFAAKDVGRIQAGVHITGTAQNPVVTLASNPAMPERDILGYLFMGRPIRNDAEGGDALAIGAGSLMPNYGDTFADYGVVELDLAGFLNNEGGVRLRKRLSESWEISSTLGAESGVDLYYLLDFD